MTRQMSAQVVVVGGGPVGLVAAHWLARWGVRTVVVERKLEPSTHPRATVVNVRTMEILRALGLSGRIRDAGVPPQSVARISWRTALAGQEIGHIDIIESAQKLMRMAAQSPELPGICPQNRIVSLLTEALDGQPNVTTLLGHTATGIVSNADRATVEVTSADGPVRIDADYVVLAEGLHGRLREQAGIRQIEDPPLGRLLDVHFRADLRRWTEQGGSAIYWVVNQHVRGAVIAVDPPAGEWLLEVPAIGDGQDELFRDDLDRGALVRAALGIDVAAEVASVRSWTMRTTTVDRWRDHSGRVFVAGDAAHTFPPTGGFGMNTGIQDVHNLAWKLAGVLHGWAEDTLLDTYEAERRPVADFNAAQSEHNALQTREFLEDHAGSLGGLLEDMGPGGEVFRAGLQPLVAEQRPHFDYPGQALGFRYGDHPVVTDIVEYHPGFRVGERAPHSWADDSREVSTCDLSADGFLLATDDSGRWRTDVPVPLRVAVLPDALPPKSAALIRPDGHVAALLPGDDPERELTDALRRAVTTHLSEEQPV